MKNIKHTITSVTSVNTVDHMRVIWRNMWMEKYEWMNEKHKTYKYKCNKCEYSAPHENDLLEHMQQTHDQGTYSCAKCEYTLNSEEGIKCHNDEKHPHTRVDENIRLPTKQRYSWLVDSKKIIAVI